MPIPFYGSINLQKNELQNAVVQNLGSAPTPAVKGQIYFDSTANILYWYNGSTWVAAQGGGALTPASTVTTQAVGDAAVVGTSLNYAREDHKHGREAFAAPTAETTFGTSSAAGSATTLPRSDHTHGNPVHDDTAHAAVHLNALAPPTADINLNTHKIINLVDPTNPQDAATKNYADNLANGLAWKAPVRAYGAANITLSGIPSSGLTDGVTLVAGDRVLLNNQSTPSQNGIYVVASGAWSRATDNDAATEMVNATVYISEGTTYADTQWTCVTNAPITIGSTTIQFQQIAGAGTYTWGNGLTNVGNTVNVNPGAGITIVSDAVTVDTTVIAKTVTTISTTAPLTGGGDLSANRTLAITSFAGSAAGAVPTSPGGTSTFLRADGTWATPGGGGTVNKYSATLGGTSSPETVTHNLNTRDVVVGFYQAASPYTAVIMDWDAATVNTLTVRYSPAPGAGAIRVVVMA